MRKEIDPTLTDKDVTMTPERRELFLKIIDGDQRNFAPVHFLYSQFPEDRLDAALHYLIRNYLIGVRFHFYFADDCKSSNLELFRSLTAKIEKDKLRPILASDFR